MLRQVRIIECELSLVALYEGQCLFREMVNLLDGMGFKPVNFEPVFSDLKTGHCLQVDGMFVQAV